MICSCLHFLSCNRISSISSSSCSYCLLTFVSTTSSSLFPFLFPISIFRFPSPSHSPSPPPPSPISTLAKCSPKLKDTVPRLLRASQRDRDMIPYFCALTLAHLIDGILPPLPSPPLPSFFPFYFNLFFHFSSSSSSASFLFVPALIPSSTPSRILPPISSYRSRLFFL